VEKSDEALVRAFVSRHDESSFRALYRRHAPRMVNLARFVGRRWERADLEDVMQESWVRAARGLPQFEWRSSLSSWLCGIVINVCREFVRRERLTDVSNERLEWSEEWVAGLDPIDLFTLTAALEALPEGYRKVVVLHDVGGFTHDEIGEMLAIDAGTSKSQLSRARTRLRDRLRGNEGA
jgi:RNA polymerase sigma-70 factor (ECF subfamily)